MIVDVSALRKKMRTKDIPLDALCDKMNMSKSTFYRKSTDGGKGFTVENISIMKNELRLNNKEFKEIFFVEEIA